MKLLVRIRNLMEIASQACPLVYNCRNWTSSPHIRCLLTLIVSPFCVLRYFWHRNISGREGMALVLIVKNEAPYIVEWLDFHIKQGVSHFLIYDNESTDNLHEVLKPHIEAGVVSYHVIKGKVRQMDSYNMAIHDYGRKFKYMGFVDADEFVFVRNSRAGITGSLYSFVDEFMALHPLAGGIAVNWCIFGSNGHITKPAGGLL